MSARDDVLEVMRWEKTGERSVRGSGGPVRCVGWREANKVARKWMDRGAGFYVSIERAAAPFSGKRAGHMQGPDFLCMTGGHDGYFASGGPLDAPEFIAAGSFYCSLNGGKWPAINGRGRWI